MRGTYVLLFALDAEQEAAIGRLGSRVFPAGEYAYVGSALGGLSHRVRRHLRAEKKLHWHIDYLLPRARSIRAWVKADGERAECATARLLLGLPGTTQPVPGFGASDCRCRAHLFLLQTSPEPALARAGFRPWLDPATDVTPARTQ